MSIEIIAYYHLRPTNTEELTHDADIREMTVILGEDAHLGALQEGGYIVSDIGYSFNHDTRAYSDWCSKLKKMAGLDEKDNNHLRPFGELFACEKGGLIAEDVADKLLGFFLTYDEHAKMFDSMSFYHIYYQWTQALRVATKMGGAILLKRR